MGTHNSTLTAPTHRHRRVAAALAVIGCAVALAACGSSGKSDARSSFNDTGIEFADCMRSHGVPDFPDPGGGGGGGGQIPVGSSINPQSPAFQSAQKACSGLLSLGKPGGGGQASEAIKVANLDISECMRRHGFSTFPDPTATAPPPGTGFALAFGRPGSFIAIPQSLVRSPGFTQAAAACHIPGAGRAGPKVAVALPG